MLHRRFMKASHIEKTYKRSPSYNRINKNRKRVSELTSHCADVHPIIEIKVINRYKTKTELPIFLEGPRNIKTTQLEGKDKYD